MIGNMEDLKASVDLNTRVHTAELAIAMVAMWQLEAVQTVGTGQTGVTDAATLAEEQRYMDFTLPTADGGMRTEGGTASGKGPGNYRGRADLRRAAA